MSVEADLSHCMRRQCEQCHKIHIPFRDLSNGGCVVTNPRVSINEKAKPHRQTVCVKCTPTNTATLTPPSEIGFPVLRSSSRSSGSGCPLWFNTGLSQPDPAQSEPIHLGSVSLSSERPTADLGIEEKAGIRKPRRISPTDRFLSSIPTGNRWRQRQLDLGLTSANKYEDDIRGFLLSADTVAVAKDRGVIHQELESELIMLGARMAVLTKSSLQNVRLRRSHAYFNVLIFLSYCKLLRQKGVSDGIVDELIQKCTNARQQDREALLRTIPWIHQLITGLVRRGWTLHRATELFFISMLGRLNYRTPIDVCNGRCHIYL